MAMIIILIGLGLGYVSMKKIICFSNVVVLLVMSFFSLSLFADDVTGAVKSVENISRGELTPAFSSWGKKSVVGSWEIVKDQEQYFIVLGDDFSAKDGPDVKVFLSPTPAKEVTGSNATEGSSLITEITRFKGQYRIAIPKNVNPNDFQSLVFHCEAYSKLWGTSSLR
ncbi:MAG: hypothetical protein ACJA0C_001255 [Candidatus Endobugula sp.]|jgi:hypothetical protein